MLTLQGCYYYNNATIVLEGEPVKLRDAAEDFFASPAWAATQTALAQFYEEVWQIGVRPALNRLLMWGGDGGISEEAAYVMLGVEPNITTNALKKKFRSITLELHPDKQPIEMREDAHHKFMEMKAAFEVIKKMRAYRAKIESAKVLREFANRFNRFDKKHQRKEDKKSEGEEMDKKNEL